MNVQPLRDCIVVTKESTGETRTASGLVLVNKVEPVLTGTVLAVGSGKVADNGAVIGASESGGDTLGSLPCATCGGDHYTKRHDDVVGGGLASAGLSESGEGE